MVTDPIADFLTRIRNALQAEHEIVEVPASRIKANITKVLKAEGYIKNFRLIRAQGNKLLIRIYFNDPKLASLNGLKRVSRPGLRVYKDSNSIPKVLNGAGTVVMTTPKGVMTGHSARRAKVGGEVLCEIW